MIGKIELNRMRIKAYHGVYAQERIHGNDFEVTVHLFYDMTDAAENDDLSCAIDYPHVIETVKSVMAKPSRLLENVVARIRDAIIAQFPNVTSGFVKVTKINPPVSVPMRAFAVKIEW